MLYLGRPEMILYEEGDWKVLQEYQGPEQSFYGGWAHWWGVGQSPIVIQHKHETKWKTASQLILKAEITLATSRQPENTCSYCTLEEDKQIEVWKEKGEWRKDCRWCHTPIPEEVRNTFDFFREHLRYE